MIKHGARIITLSTLLLTLLLSACGGGNPNGNGGRLSVTISGLPTGVDAAVTVTGPSNYKATLTASQTLSGLAPGQYAVAAANVTVGGSVYAATVKGSPAKVSAGQTATASTSYKQVANGTGSLFISVSGVPAGVTPPTVTITGPTGPYSHKRTVSTSTTLQNLIPGSYTVTAPSITWKGQTVKPSIHGSPATVEVGSTASVTVSYPTSPNGGLSVTITGLPSGIDADVTVSGPNGFSKKVTAGQTIPNLVPGSYTITADDVTVSGDVGEDVYTGTVSGSPVTVQEGVISSASVAYTTTTGDLNVTIGGLPEGTDGDVTVTGPGSYSHHLTTTATTLRGLTPGGYTVSAQPVTANGTKYNPGPPSASATVKAGKTDTAISIAYNPPYTGSLIVNINGLPEGIDAAVTLTQPNGVQSLLTGSKTIGDLIPGSYTVTAADVPVNGNIYTATIMGSPAHVMGGTTKTVTVNYTPTTGNLRVDISGLPSGTDANVAVTGPGNYKTILTATNGKTLTGLALGSYTITAEDVTTTGSNSETYSGTVKGSPAIVSAGATVQSSVTYAQSTGDLTVNIDSSALPSGTNVDVTVKGPAPDNSFTQIIHSTQTLTNLTPGSYTISAPPVTVNDVRYTAIPQQVMVSNGPGQPATATITYQANDFSLELSNTSLNIPFDSSAQVTITAHPLGVFNGDIIISLSNLPPGVSASLTSTTIANNSSATLTLTSDITAAINNAVTVSVNGTSGSLSHNANLTVTVIPEVTSSADDSGPGTLRDLVTNVPTTAANPTITFDPTVFNTDTTIMLASTLPIAQDLTIQGPTDVAVTLSGNSAVQVMSVSGDATATITNLTIANGSSSSGGGIDNTGTLTLQSSTVSGNSANAGGGIDNTGTLTLVNSTISGNSVGRFGTGGGIDNTGTLTLVNSTISGNSAGGFGTGGGIYNGSAGDLILKNTIVAGNTVGALGAAPDIFTDTSGSPPGAINSGGYNLIGDGTDSNLANGTGDQVGTSANPIDPMLGTLADNGGPTETMALQTGSPAIDQIPISPTNYCTDTSGNAITTDQRGEPRPTTAPGMCDIGAFEVQPSGSD